MKILFTPMTGSSIAHVVRSLALADELSQRGHEIFFTSCYSKKSFIESQGYNIVNDYPTVNINDPKDQSSNYISAHRDLFINWFKAEIDAAKKIKPDLVIAAPCIFGPHIYYATKIPTIAINDSQYLPESRGIMGIAKANNNLIHNILCSVIRPKFEKKFIELYLNEVNKIYKELGIKHDFKNRKELYKPMGVIIPSDEIMEPLRVPRNKTIYSGPIFWKGFEKMETDLTDEKIKNFKKNKKLIYVSFGASVFDKKVYKVVLRGLVKTRHRVIIALGPNWNRSEFPPDNNNILIRSIVPGMRLSKYADVILNTGSQGAVMQGLYYGKPQIAFPTIMDQAFFANRLEELKIGININKVGLLKFSKRENFSKFPDRIAERILEAIALIEQKDYYKSNAEKYIKNISKYPNPSKIAADFIEQYIK